MSYKKKISITLNLFLKKEVTILFGSYIFETFQESRFFLLLHKDVKEKYLIILKEESVYYFLK